MLLLSPKSNVWKVDDIDFSVVLWTSNICSYLTQVLKVRLNLQTAGTYNGVLGYAKLIYQNESVAAFYRGFKPSILCMIPYAGVECAVHQVIQIYGNGNYIHVCVNNAFNINTFSLLSVHFKLGQTGPSPHQWPQTLPHQFRSICLRTGHQLPSRRHQNTAASSRWMLKWT